MSLFNLLAPRMRIAAAVALVMGLLPSGWSAQPGAAQGGGTNLLADADGQSPDVAAHWKGNVRRTTADAKFGEACLEFAAPGITEWRGRIAIDPEKTYAISGMFKSARSDQLSRVLLDLRFLTGEGKPIGPWAVAPVTSVSIVTEGAKAGEKRIKVAKKDWPADVGKFRRALNAREDFSDLPNFQTFSISRFVVGRENYEITLVEPLAGEIPAGTKVRLHKYENYPRVWNNHVPREWTLLTFLAGREAPLAIWPGAKYSVIKILHQYNEFPKPLPAGEPSPVLLFDDIAVCEVFPAH